MAKRLVVPSAARPWARKPSVDSLTKDDWAASGEAREAARRAQAMGRRDMVLADGDGDIAGADDVDDFAADGVESREEIAVGGACEGRLGVEDAEVERLREVGDDGGVVDDEEIGVEEAGEVLAAGLGDGLDEWGDLDDIAEGAVGEDLAAVEDDGERAGAGGGLGVAGDEVFEAGFTVAGG